jgi:hypothetical protein
MILYPSQTRLSIRRHNRNEFLDRETIHCCQHIPHIDFVSDKSLDVAMTVLSNSSITNK